MLPFQFLLAHPASKMTAKQLTVGGATSWVD